MSKAVYNIKDYSVQDDGGSNSPLKFDSVITNNRVTPGNPASVTLSIKNTDSRPIALLYTPAGVSPFGFVVATVNQRLNDPKNITLSDQLVLYNNQYDMEVEETIITAPESRETALIRPLETITRSFFLPIEQQGDMHLSPNSYTIKQYQEYAFSENSLPLESGAELHQMIARVSFEVVKK